LVGGKMSRLASKPIKFDNSVKIELIDDNLKIKGPKGELLVKLNKAIEVKIKDNGIIVNLKDDLKKSFSRINLEFNQ